MRWFWAHALLCLGLLACSTRPANADTDCKELLQEYYKANTKEAVPYTGSNMVYFLHIPRTAGRTFYSCLLRIGTPGRRRCPKAYDHLRINTELPQCYLLSSHDDFSVVESLPPETAVVSQLRDPVQRVLSAYEFAIEVAARQLRRSKNYVKPKNRVVTDDVWPWSYLIPFFVNDMKPKVRQVAMLPGLQLQAVLPPPPPKLAVSEPCSTILHSSSFWHGLVLATHGCWCWQDSKHCTILLGVVGRVCAWGWGPHEHVCRNRSGTAHPEKGRGARQS